ncbi:VOC family protein [Streptomyces sp. TRM72054]|uniref:VOC family protein n=1 Tax=Streptomyces sp. TRM72054 TaxID=2870562 RepID=UPI0035ABDB40
MCGAAAFFEIGVADPERGRAFYGALFGWNLHQPPGGRHGRARGIGAHQGGAGPDASGIATRREVRREVRRRGRRPPRLVLSTPCPVTS